MGSPDRHALESILGDLPDNVLESELPFLEAIETFLMTGRYDGVKKIPRNQLRLLRVKFSGFSEPGKPYLRPPVAQLVGVMDLRLAELERRTAVTEKLWLIVVAAIVGAAAGALIRWLSGG